jgi:hypothetical protein
MIAKTFAAAVHGVDDRILKVEIYHRNPFPLNFSIQKMSGLRVILRFSMGQRMSQNATTSKILTHEK